MRSKYADSEFDNEDEVVDWINNHINGVSHRGILICEFKVARMEGYSLEDSFSIASRKYLEAVLKVTNE